MKPRFSFWLTAAFLILSWSFLPAQQATPIPVKIRKVNFQHFPADNGLSTGTFRAILHDRKGLIWYGTWDGLVKFDGYSYKAYRNNIADLNSLPSNYVAAIAEDPQQEVLWLGTTNGFARFDMRTEEFNNYFHAPDDPQSIWSDDIVSLHVAGNGVIWIGTESKGLQSFDPETETFTFHPVEGDSFPPTC